MIDQVALQLLFRIASGVLDALGLLSVVQGLLKSNAQEHVPFQIESAADNASIATGSPTFGNAALLVAINGVRDQVIAAATALTLQIEGLPGPGVPVTLPTIPPAGYGGQSLADIATAVWGNLQFGDLASPYQYVQAGGRSNLSLGGTTGYRPDGGLFAYYYTGLNSAGDHPTFYPAGNFSDILATDNLLTWLARVNPTADCLWWAGPGSWVEVIGNNGDGPAQFMTVIDDSQFQAIKESLGLASPLVGPSLWPGLAKVTLGSSVALSRVTTLTEEMDGAIVTLTAVPPNKPTYVLGGLVATAHIGQIAFVADNGAAEYPQNLSFASEIYVPLALVGATAVVLRTIPGVTGTVQAWKRTV